MGVEVTVGVVVFVSSGSGDTDSVGVKLGKDAGVPVGVDVGISNVTTGEGVGSFSVGTGVSAPGVKAGVTVAGTGVGVIVDSPCDSFGVGKGMVCR
ncbi:MAG: hypothetical protein BWY82_02489 [Verrucomicrobia bacterium ADurb.Bin474]|nr:MAG: hypothetical protein BWY82_02489 [Verrucomicrobia bacterium ADurb.Bin474]